MTDADDAAVTRIRFVATVVDWRGPSPYFFAPVPEAEAETIRRLARALSYGWGMIPVAARIGDVEFTTALFPKDGTFLLPLKDAVRRKAEITAGDAVEVELTLQARAR